MTDMTQLRIYTDYNVDYCRNGKRRGRYKDKRRKTEVMIIVTNEVYINITFEGKLQYK